MLVVCHLDCGLPTQYTDTYYLGNMFTIGKRVQYVCMEGMSMTVTTTRTSTCDSQGTWSPVGITCYQGKCAVSDF